MTTAQNNQDGFDATFLQEIRDLLEDRKVRIDAELNDFTHENPRVKGDREAKFPEYGDDEEDNVQEVVAYTTNKPLELTLEKELRDIEKALKRLDEGTYGICKYCDKPIHEKRLRARPESGSCVECKKTLTDEI